MEKNDNRYQAALALVERIIIDLEQGTGHYRDRQGRLLTELGQVIDAILNNNLQLESVVIS